MDPRSLNKHRRSSCMGQIFLEKNCMVIMLIKLNKIIDHIFFASINSCVHVRTILTIFI